MVVASHRQEASRSLLHHHRARDGSGAEDGCGGNAAADSGVAEWRLLWRGSSVAECAYAVVQGTASARHAGAEPAGAPGRPGSAFS